MSIDSFLNNFNRGFLFGMSGGNPMFSCFNGFGNIFNGGMFCFGGFNNGFNFNFNFNFTQTPILFNNIWNNSIWNNNTNNFWNNNSASIFNIGQTSFNNSIAFNFSGIWDNVNISNNSTNIFSSSCYSSLNSDSSVTSVSCNKKTEKRTDVEDNAVNNPIHTTDIYMNTSSDKYYSQMLAKIREREGNRVTNHKNDRGGLTNNGVTQSTYNTYRSKKGLPKQSVKNITEAEIQEIYKNIYKECGADKVKNPQLALLLFDMAVNSGSGNAKKIFARCNGNVDKFIELREDYYRNIVKKDSSQSGNLKGWLNRLNIIGSYAKTLPTNRESA